MEDPSKLNYYEMLSQTHRHSLNERTDLGLERGGSSGA